MHVSWVLSRSWRQQVRSAGSTSVTSGAVVLLANMVAQ